MQSRTPFSHGGDEVARNGAAEDVVLELEPAAAGIGSMRSQVSPYWPRPPVCFLYLPCTSARPFTVSL